MGVVAVQDEVSGIEFAVETGLGPGEIRAAGHRAAAAARRYLRTSLAESFANGSSVRYLATGPDLARQMVLLLTWEQVVRRRRVRLTVEEFAVEQSRLLFVPVGRRTVPALASARRFAAALQAELTGMPVRAEPVRSPRRPRSRPVPARF